MRDTLLHLPDGLTPLERSVITMMLDRPGERFASVAAQISQAVVSSRQHTGVGGYTNFTVPTHAPFYRALQDGYIGDVCCQIGSDSGQETQADFVLLVDDGCVCHLEFVTPDKEWPKDETQFRLYYFDPVA